MKRTYYLIALVMASITAHTLPTRATVYSQLTETQRTCVCAALRHLHAITQQKIATIHFSNDITAHDLSQELAQNALNSEQGYTKLCNLSDTLLSILQKITPLDYYSLETKAQLELLLKQLHTVTQKLKNA